MSAIGYVFMSAFVLFISWQLFRRAAGDMSLLRPNMISFTFYYSLLLQSFVGVNLAIHWLENHYLISRIRDFEVRQMAYFTVLYVMIAMPLAMWLTSLVLRARPKSLLKSYVRLPLVPALSPKDSYVYYPFVFLTLLCLLAILYTFYTLGQVPLLAVFSGAGARALQMTRVTAYRGFAGNVYIRNLFAIGLPPILSYTAIGYYWLYGTRKWAVLSLLLVFLAVLMAIHGLSKAPLLNYLLGIVFLSVLVAKLRPRHVLWIAAGLASLVIVLYVVLGRVTDPRLLLALNTGPVGRVLLGQITSLFYHFRIFPEEHPFLGGASLPALLLKLLGTGQVHKTSARLVMEIVSPAGVASGQAGVMNTLFAAEAFANWGWLGVALAPLWVGFVIQIIYIFCLRTRKTPLLVGVFAFLSYQIPSMVTGGFVGFIYNPGVLALVLLGLGPFIGGIVSKSTLSPRKHVSRTG